MRTVRTLSLLALVVVIAGVVSCKSNESSAAKPLDLPKELTLDLGSGVSMKLVLIPAGKFMMGSTKEEQEAARRGLQAQGFRGLTDSDIIDGGLQHEVTISTPFYMGVYEVTQEQYEAVIGKNPSDFKGAKNPVEMVSWDDAYRFCMQVSKKTGIKVRLPTEAQWEYACRAGSETKFNFGNTEGDLCKNGNYLDKSNTSDFFWKDKEHSDGFAKTAPVGSFTPNGFGLYDMHGNVWEYCSDWFADSYVKANNPDPVGPGSGKGRVLRGGGWESPLLYCQSASRITSDPSTFKGSDNIGFRLVVLAANTESPRQSSANVLGDRDRRVVEPYEELELDLGRGVKMRLALIPSGKFVMGSSKAEQAKAGEKMKRIAKSDKSPEEIYAHEGPAHEVTLTKPFYIGIYEVTCGQFAAFVADTNYKTDAEKEGNAFGLNTREPDRKLGMWDGYSWKKTGLEHTDDHPVLNVSWNDAAEFCKWLARKSGRRVKLPTEAQWEYACRGRTKTSYPWGDKPDQGRGWCNVGDEETKRTINLASSFDFRDKYMDLAPVGQFNPNDFGLYDMIGNAREWCSDWFEESYKNANDRDPAGPGSGKYRVLRGSNWLGDPEDSRSASRGCAQPNRTYGDGFRVAVDGASPSSQPAAQASPQPAAQPSSQPAAQPSTQPVKELSLGLGNKVTMKLVEIPAGKFLMGSPAGEKDRQADEGPQHEVTISKPFYMGMTHVTRDQFAAFVKDSGFRTQAEKDNLSGGAELHRLHLFGKSWRESSFVQTGGHPVVHLSWNDAYAFCEWLSKKSGIEVRLPTEAEWEYACRAGTTTAYPWGDTPDDGNSWANCRDQRSKKELPNSLSDFFNFDDGYPFTSPVGSFKANSFGLYDMIGNAFQWCEDRYGEYEKDKATDPAGPYRNQFRVMRGGSWCSGPGPCRSASRYGFSPFTWDAESGFRVAVPGTITANGVVAPLASVANCPASRPSDPMPGERWLVNRTESDIYVYIAPYAGSGHDRNNVYYVNSRVGTSEYDVQGLIEMEAVAAQKKRPSGRRLLLRVDNGVEYKAVLPVIVGAGKCDFKSIELVSPSSGQCRTWNLFLGSAFQTSPITIKLFTKDAKQSIELNGDTNPIKPEDLRDHLQARLKALGSNRTAVVLFPGREVAWEFVRYTHEQAQLAGCDYLGLAREVDGGPEDFPRNKRYTKREDQVDLGKTEGADSSKTPAQAGLGLTASDAAGGPKSRFFGSGGNAYHIVYVVDRSGSMAPTFQQVQNEMLKSISQLKQAQDFSIILFADNQFIEGPQKRLVSAELVNKLAANTFLKDITANGSTTVLPALKRAFQVLKDTDASKPGRLIYLLSNGDFAGKSSGSEYTSADGKVLKGNEAVIQWLRDNNPKDEKKGLVHVNTFLYLSKDEEAKKVMETIAKENGGWFKLISAEE